MADPITIALVGSTILSATGAASEGIAANRAAKYNAAGEVAAGKQAVGASQRRAWQETRKGNLVASRAQAVAAASGGSASDPSVIDIMGGIEAQTDYNALTALYEGQEAQRGHETQASLDRFEGKQAQTAGFLKAGKTLLSGAGGLYDKYGGGGFAKFDPSSGNWAPGREGFPSDGYG